MRKLVLALIAAALNACASSPESVARKAPDSRGHATPDGAAFMGYHGPAWRSNTPAD